MNARTDPKPMVQADSIDFEIVPVEAARAAHDQLPPGVESVPTLAPGYWQQRRRKPVPSDRALTGAAIDWLLSLSPARRPTQLPERFPRVANRIAEARPGPQRMMVLAELLNDRRCGRGGFPAEVRREIEALYDDAVRLAPRAGDQALRSG